LQNDDNGARLRARITNTVLFTCLVLAASALGCGDSESHHAPTVTLRFWNGFTGPDGRTMLAIIKRFNGENPDVHVIMQRAEWSTMYNKLFVAGLGGRAPEVFVIHTDTLRRFQLAGFVRPVDDLIGADGIDPSDIDENVWRAVEFEGQHFGVPLDIHPLGLYFNKTLFKQAGISKPPTNREEFLDDLRKLKSEPHQWGFVFTWLRTNFYTVLCQNNGAIFRDDLSATVINSPQNVEALKFCADLVRRERLAPSPENFDSWIGFRQGKVAMVFEGIYMLPDLQRQKDLDYGAAPVPTLFARPAVWCNSHNLCLRAGLSGAELSAAKRFVKYLSDNSLDWALGGQVPVRKSLRRSARFAQMEAQHEFARQIPYAHYMPSVPFIFEYQREFDLAVESALRGSRTPKEALDIAATNITKIVDRQRSEDRDDN
jgi:multiple sugar transport system substrate-binding protein